MCAKASVKVAVRVRMMNQKEINQGDQVVIWMENNETHLKHPTKGDVKKYKFDYSYWSIDGYKVEPNTKRYVKDNPFSKYIDQVQIYQDLGLEVIQNAFEGYHTCLFAYGQTGSGKSYSIVGSEENPGVIPMVCKEIFTRIDKLKANPMNSSRYTVEIQMIEIYNENIRNLLANTEEERKQVHEIKGSGEQITIDGIDKIVVNTYEEMRTLYDIGNHNRTIGATKMNQTSSRAHTIFTITLTIAEFYEGKQATAKRADLNLVDLAGSERLGKTEATGERLKEGTNINLSLSTLGRVISVLAEQSMGKKLNEHVPFRDSKLTRILQNALSGNSRTTMIATISPAASNYEETLSTLLYADRVKRIRVSAKANISNNDELLRLRAENEQLKKMLAEHGGNRDELLRKIREENERKLNEERDKINELKEKLILDHKQVANVDKFKGKCQIRNLNEDPLLAGKIKHLISNGHNSVGKQDSTHHPSIPIVGNLGIGYDHCIINYDEVTKQAVLTPTDPQNCKILVNGNLVTAPIILSHQDRILFGNNSYFAFAEEGKELDPSIDWEYAMKEANKNMINQIQTKTEDSEALKKIKQLEEELKLEKDRNLNEMNQLQSKSEEEKERLRKEMEEKALKLTQESVNSGEFKKKLAELEKDLQEKQRKAEEELKIKQEEIRLEKEKAAKEINEMKQKAEEEKDRLKKEAEEKAEKLKMESSNAAEYKKKMAELQKELNEKQKIAENEFKQKQMEMNNEKNKNNQEMQNMMKHLEEEKIRLKKEMDEKAKKLQYDTNMSEQNKKQLDALEKELAQKQKSVEDYFLKKQKEIQNTMSLREINFHQILNSEKRLRLQKEMEEQLIELMPKLNEVNEICISLGRAKYLYLPKLGTTWVDGKEVAKVDIMVYPDKTQDFFNIIDKELFMDKYFEIKEKFDNYMFNTENFIIKDNLDDISEDPKIFGVGILNNANLIGHAHIYLETIAHLCQTENDVTVLIDKQGNKVGNLTYCIILKLKNEKGKEEDLLMYEKIDELKGRILSVTIKVLKASGIPLERCFDTFCQYTWIDEKEELFTSSIVQKVSQNPEFNYEKIHQLFISEYVIQKMWESTLVISVYGKMSPEMVEALRKKLKLDIVPLKLQQNFQKMLPNNQPLNIQNATNSNFNNDRLRKIEEELRYERERREKAELELDRTKIDQFVKNESIPQNLWKMEDKIRMEREKRAKEEQELKNEYYKQHIPAPQFFDKLENQLNIEKQRRIQAENELKNAVNSNPNFQDNQYYQGFQDNQDFQGFRDNQDFQDNQDNEFHNNPNDYEKDEYLEDNNSVLSNKSKQSLNPTPINQNQISKTNKSIGGQGRITNSTKTSQFSVNSQISKGVVGQNLPKGINQNQKQKMEGNTPNYYYNNNKTPLQNPLPNKFQNTNINLNKNKNNPPQKYLPLNYHTTPLEPNTAISIPGLPSEAPTPNVMPVQQKREFNKESKVSGSKKMNAQQSQNYSNINNQPASNNYEAMMKQFLAEQEKNNPSYPKTMQIKSNSPLDPPSAYAPSEHGSQYNYSNMGNNEPRSPTPKPEGESPLPYSYEQNTPSSYQPPNKKEEKPAESSACIIF